MPEAVAARRWSRSRSPSPASGARRVSGATTPEAGTPGDPWPRGTRRPGSRLATDPIRARSAAILRQPTEALLACPPALTASPRAQPTVALPQACSPAAPTASRRAQPARVDLTLSPARSCHAGKTVSDPSHLTAPARDGSPPEPPSAALQRLPVGLPVLALRYTGSSSPGKPTGSRGSGVTDSPGGRPAAGAAVLFAVTPERRPGWQAGLPAR